MRTRALLAWVVVVALASPAVLPAAVRAAGLTVGGSAAVLTDDGTGLYMRKQPSRHAKRIGAINEGDVVTIDDGPYYDEDGAAWYLVDYGGLTGYAFGDFLVPVDGADPGSGSSRGDYRYSAADVGVVPILMYHHVDYSGGTYAVTPEQLDAQCQWLLDNGYTAITLTDFYDGAFAGGLLPAKPVVLTDDDGWASALTFADVLARYGFVGNYFVDTESEVTPDQIAYLGQVGEVEDHTVSHAALSQLAYGAQYAEIANNKAYLDSVTGQAAQFLAWPYGDWNASAVQAAADSGIIAAFDAWGGPADLTTLDPWHIPRVLVDGGYDLDTFAAVVTGA
ncbi:MAG TPA: polysaccharide deacetylase family protein [Thermomicrobiales bacterium]|jgi:peptidoglycan/xylan/chitin deacetylase (PgdA/CDA1 family)